MSIAKTFTAALQASHLKAAGFQKRYETFSKVNPAYSEHYHIEAAGGNRSGEPWSYHLVIGIGFNAIPSKHKGQLAGTHASKRLLTIETTLLNPADTDTEKLRFETGRLAAIIAEQSDYFKNRHEILRRSFDRGLFHHDFPADPETDH